ncbi:hypothetical protein HZA96_05645 [Candidatus Woesearchaeota archaeon]|nr:hypothetical protein [Candidatus Woesearchaeota archaeon]
MEEVRIERFKPKISKKQFFVRPSPSEMQKGKNVASAENNIVELVEDLDYVPLIDNDFSRVLAFSIATHHECKVPSYDRGYAFEISNESQKRIYFDAHAIFAYFALATHYIEEARKKNIPYNPNKPNDFRVQRRNSPFALPTEDQMIYNLKLMNNVLIEGTNEKGKTQLYPLNKAEQEILTWGRVIKRGHDATLFATKPLWKYNLDAFIK